LTGSTARPSWGMEQITCCTSFEIKGSMSIPVVRSHSQHRGIQENKGI
jgi:hypothetical protein